MAGVPTVGACNKPRPRRLIDSPAPGQGSATLFGLPHHGTSRAQAITIRKAIFPMPYPDMGHAIHVETMQREHGAHRLLPHDGMHRDVFSGCRHAYFTTFL